jgi:hypothetical protein
MGPGEIAWLDNLSLKSIITADLFTLRNLGPSLNNFGASLRLGGYQAGIIFQADLPESPTKYLLARHDGINLILEKVLPAGVTTYITSAQAHVDWNQVKIVRSAATTYQLYHKGVQIGADQTISDANINSNIYYGVLLTDVACGFKTAVWG